MILGQDRVCPDCGVWDMREGLSSGLATNIRCGNCGSCFNYVLGLFFDRIHPMDKFTKIQFEDFKGYRPFNKYIANK